MSPERSPTFAMSSSSDESDDAVNAHASTVKSSLFPSQLKTEVRSSSQSSSSEDDTNPTNRGLALKRPPDSSSESESDSDDNHHSAKNPEPSYGNSDNYHEGLTKRLSHQKSSSDDSSSSEDEDRPPKQQLSKESTSNDDSSDHEDKYRARQMVNQPQQSIQNDSGDDSSNSKGKPARVVRAAHTMSSSDSEDSDNEEVRATPEIKLESSNKNQIPTDENSSESESDDSDNDRIKSTAQSNAPVGIISRKPNDDQVQIKHQDSDESSSDESTGHVSNNTHVAKVKKEHDVRSLPVASGNDSLTNKALRYFGFSTERGEHLLNSAFKEYDSIDPSGCLLSLEEVSNNQEIWLIQCPKSMNLTSLKKQHLLLGGNSDFQIEDGPTFKRFSVSSEPSHTTVNCVLPSTNSGNFHVASLPIMGKMVIQEHVHVPKLRHLEASESGPVPFPSGLRVRHPLLGIGFQEHITNVQSALRESQLASKKKKILTKDTDSDESQWPKKKSKKRKRESYEATDVDDVDGSIASFVQPLSKKQRMNYSIDQPVAANDLVLNSFEKKKKKRDKYASDILSLEKSSVFSDSLSCNEGNGIDSSKKRRRSTHDASDSLTSLSFTNMNSEAFGKKLKKHKKSKSDSSIHSDSQTLDSSSIYESVSDSDRKMKKKLKKAEKEMSFSHNNHASETDLLVESSSKEHRKRNKSHSVTTSDSQILEVKESSFADEHSVKKHKKQKKSKSKLEFDDSENGKSKLSSLNEPTGKKKIKLKAMGDISSDNIMSKSPMPMWHIPQTDDLPSSVQNREISVDKKPKKKKDRDNDSLMLSPSEIKKEYSGLNGYNNESESDVSHKKKKSKKKHKMEID